MRVEATADVCVLFPGSKLLLTCSQILPGELRVVPR